MKKHFFLVFFFVFFQTAFGQTVASIADKKNILIGEQLHLQLFAEFKNGRQPTWFRIDSIPHFEILDQSKLDTLNTAGSITLKQVLTLTSWDSGQLQIPSFTLGKSKTDPVKINVTYSPSPFDVSQPYHDIKDIIEVKNPPESKWYWYFLLLALLIVLFLLFFPKEKKKEQPAFVPDETAYKAALKKLDQLQLQNDNKLFYTELVQIFREYLFRRKNIYSFSKTTDDLAIQINSLKIPEDKYRDLLQALRLSDLVKFAQLQPTPQESKKALEILRENIIIIENLSDAV